LCLLQSAVAAHVTLTHLPGGAANPQLALLLTLCILPLRAGFSLLPGDSTGYQAYHIPSAADHGAAAYLRHLQLSIQQQQQQQPYTLLVGSGTFAEANNASGVPGGSDKYCQPAPGDFDGYVHAVPNVNNAGTTGSASKEGSPDAAAKPPAASPATAGGLAADYNPALDAAAAAAAAAAAGLVPAAAANDAAFNAPVVNDSITYNSSSNYAPAHIAVQAQPQDAAGGGLQAAGLGGARGLEAALAAMAAAKAAGQDPVLPPGLLATLAAQLAQSPQAAPAASASLAAAAAAVAAAGAGSPLLSQLQGLLQQQAANGSAIVQQQQQQQQVPVSAMPVAVKQELQELMPPAVDAAAAAAAAVMPGVMPPASPLVRPAASPSPAFATSPLAPQQLDLPPAAAAAAGGPSASGPKISLPPLSPLPPPDASEPHEVHAEYQEYLKRFAAGDTLAQRWHRLAEKGLLDGVREEWEDWQHDVMLQQLQAGLGGGKGRGRGRGKRDEVEVMNADELGPRKVRCLNVVTYEE
jgi:hypothetical protein